MLTTGADRKDVRRFQNRTDFLAGLCAPVMVCIRDQSLEGALAYSLNNEPSFTSRLLLSKSSRFQIEDISARIQVSGNRLDYRMARVQVVKVIELPSLSCWREVRRCTQCIPRAEKGNVA